MATAAATLPLGPTHLALGESITIPSTVEPSRTYAVSNIDGALHCSCPGFFYHERCKHLAGYAAEPKPAPVVAPASLPSASSIAQARAFVSPHADLIADIDTVRELASDIVAKLHARHQSLPVGKDKRVLAGILCDVENARVRLHDAARLLDYDVSTWDGRCLLCSREADRPVHPACAAQAGSEG